MSHKNPQRMTVVTENFVTLSHGLVLPRLLFSLSSQPSADHHTTDLHLTTSWPKAPATVDDVCGYVKDACTLNPKAASTLQCNLHNYCQGQGAMQLAMRQ